jgi:Signal transduction histidine kinase involved in nitrogen fixation and metabolism regulation
MKLILAAAMLLTAALAAAAPFFLAGTPLYVGEAVLAVLFVLGIIVYRRVLLPVMALKHGIDLLQAQDFSSRLAKVGSRDADNIGAVFNRMMDALKNERLRVMERNQFLDMLIEASPMGIVIYDFNGSISDMNSAARSLLDNDELRCATEELQRGEVRTVRLSDTRIYRLSSLTFLDRGFQRPFVLMESLSEEVRKVEKAAYGKVIRQMSHEVNNTVAGVTPVLDTLAAIADDPDLTETVTASSDRLLSLSRFVTNYAEMVKLPAPDLHEVNLTALVESMIPFLESLTAGREIRISTDVERENPVILRADPVQIEQVIVNIVKNSIESIAGSTGSGTVTVRLTGHGLEVADNGGGISPEVAENLFTPFFTTKNSGNGIGLMLVSEILHNHGFAFSLRTYADGITRFRIRV